MIGQEFEALADDLDATIAEILAAIGQASGRWEHGRPGSWTVGHHAAHVGITLLRTAEDLEAAERSLRAGTLAPVPTKRDPIQRLFVWLVAGRGFMPRGGKTAGWAVPPERPDLRHALDALRQGADRHRVLGARLDAGERDRLWIANPFKAGWHYRMPEVVRVQAVHARHHAKQIAQIAVQS